MGWRFRRSKQIAPGIRLNFSRRGVGVSAGPRGLKISRGSDGRIRRTVSIPGTGIYNTSVVSSRKQRRPMSTQHASPPGGDEPMPGTDADSTGLRAWARRHPKTSAVGTVLAALLVIGSFGDDDGGGDSPATDAAVAQGAADRGAVDQTEREKAERQAAEEEAARKAAEAEAERQAAQVEAERVATEKAAAEAAAAQVAAAEAARVEAARLEAEQRAASEEAARAEAQRQAAAQAAAAPPAGGTDPQFGTCKEAKADGYGPYRQGTDAEYSWYRDADSDGIVCE